MGQLIYDEPGSVYYRKVLGEANNTGLKLIDQRSPAHYLHWVNTEDDEAERAVFTFGRGLHARLLEPEVFARTYSVLPEDAPRRPTAAQWNAAKSSPASQAAKDWWTLWNLENEGREILTASAYDTINRMGDSARNTVLEIPVAGQAPLTILGAELFDHSQKEVTMRWKDPRTGLNCKARADLGSKELRFGADVKSCEDGSPEAFARAVMRYRYHQQHAHYADGAHECEAPWDGFYFIAIEKAAPYVTTVYELDVVAVEHGRKIRDRAIDKLAACVASNRWDGYSRGIHTLTLPSYAYYE